MNNKLAFLFPGQGSQFLGMLADLAQHYPQVHETYQNASEILGKNLWSIIQEGPEKLLNQTEITQPAILTASVAIWKIYLAKAGPKPDVLAGHSLGEYSALVCAGALQFEDAVALVAARGRFMQAAVPEGIGAMAAIIGLTPDKVQQVCQESEQGQVVTPANFNAIGQIVIAGHKEAVDRAIIAAKNAGAKLAKLIPVSVPSHCDLMSEAANKLAKTLEKIEISSPNIPVINNVNVAIVSDADSIKSALIKQLYHPVRWVEIIQKITGMGIEDAYECGPGKVLTGLNKRIDKNLQTQPLSEVKDLEEIAK